MKEQRMKEYIPYDKILCTNSWSLLPFEFCLHAFCWHSVQRSNCYMVCGGDAVGPSSSSRSSSDLEIGCLIDLATGLVSFTANGKELSTAFQVKKEEWLEDKLLGIIMHAIISSSCGKYTTLCVSTAQHSFLLSLHPETENSGIID